LLKNGSDKVIGECRHRIFDLKSLQRFQYIDDKDVDHGLSIRERSKQICDLVNDNDRLKDERKNAARVYTLLINEYDYYLDFLKIR
jgi:epsin